MPKYIIFNMIMSDGTGDFSHFVDVIEALKASQHFFDIEFWPIVLFEQGGTEKNKARVQGQLSDLGYGEVALFGDEDAHIAFILNTAIQAQIKAVDQIIVISSEGPLVDLYAPYFRKNIPIKLIGEHENTLTAPDNTRGALVTYASLGLSPGTAGIKIKAIAAISPKAAWRILSKENPEFLKRLLNDSGCSNLNIFSKYHMIVPAYFNTENDFWIFFTQSKSMQKTPAKRTSTK